MHKMRLARLAALLLSCLFLCPLALVFVRSLKMGAAAYAEVLFENTVFLGRFWFSLALALLEAAAQCLVSLFSAFLMTHPFFKKSGGLRFLYIFFFLLPFQASALPHFLFAKQSGLYNSVGALIVFAGFAPLGVCLLSGFVLALPNETFEAALLDTAQPFQVLLRIILPGVGGAVRALFVIAIAAALSAVELPLVVLKSERLLPLSILIAQMPGGGAAHYAACVLYMLPAALLYFAFSGDVLNGLAAVFTNGVTIK